MPWIRFNPNQVTIDLQRFINEINLERIFIDNEGFYSGYVAQLPSERLLPLPYQFNMNRNFINRSSISIPCFAPVLTLAPDNLQTETQIYNADLCHFCAQESNPGTFEVVFNLEDTACRPDENYNIMVTTANGVVSSASPDSVPGDSLSFELNFAYHIPAPNQENDTITITLIDNINTTPNSVLSFDVKGFTEPFLLDFDIDKPDIFMDTGTIPIFLDIRWNPCCTNDIIFTILEGSMFTLAEGGDSVTIPYGQNSTEIELNHIIGGNLPLQYRVEGCGNPFEDITNITVGHPPVELDPPLAS